MFIRAVLNFSGFIRAKKYKLRGKKGVNQKVVLAKKSPIHGRQIPVERLAMQSTSNSDKLCFLVQY